MSDRNQSSMDRVTKLLETLDQVVATSVEENRVPPLLKVELADSTIPAGVKDVIEFSGANIEDVKLYDETFALWLSIPKPYEGAGVRKIREQGSSTVLTLPEKVLSIAGYELGDEIEFYVSDSGETRLQLQG